MGEYNQKSVELEFVRGAYKSIKASINLEIKQIKEKIAEEQALIDEEICVKKHVEDLNKFAQAFSFDVPKEWDETLNHCRGILDIVEHTNGDMVKKYGITNEFKTLDDIIGFLSAPNCVFKKIDSGGTYRKKLGAKEIQGDTYDLLSATLSLMMFESFITKVRNALGLTLRLCIDNDFETTKMSDRYVFDSKNLSIITENFSKFITQINLDTGSDFEKNRIFKPKEIQTYGDFAEVLKEFKKLEPVIKQGLPKMLDLIEFEDEHELDLRRETIASYHAQIDELKQTVADVRYTLDVREDEFYKLIGEKHKNEGAIIPVPKSIEVHDDSSESDTKINIRAKIKLRDNGDEKPDEVATSEKKRKIEKIVPKEITDEINKLPKKERDKIWRAIDSFNPIVSKKHSKKLYKTYDEDCRLEAGKWRLAYYYNDEGSVEFTALEPRTKNTYKKIRKTL